MQQELVHTEEKAKGDHVRAWDLPTRLFHWALVTLVAMAYVSRHWGDEGLVWHTWNGYAILVLVVWRLTWGIIGSSTSRFSAILYGPAAAIRYGLDFIAGRPRHFLGHNPLGGTVALILLATVGIIGLLGLFAYDDHDALTGGPLSSRVGEAAVAFATRWHLRLFDLLLWIIGLHVAANVLYLAWKKENLVQAMFTGRKRARPYEDQALAHFASPWRALVSLLLAVVIVMGGITLAGGKII
jgi:cytochrome b